MTVLLIVNFLSMAGIAYLVYRDARRYDKGVREDGEPYSFIPESIQRRIRDPRRVVLASSSRLSLTKDFIEQEEAESKKVKVIS